MVTKGNEGDIVRIALGEQSVYYAKLLVFPLMSFFDICGLIEDPAPRLLSEPMLFKIWVSKEGWQNKRWRKIGKEAVSPSERLSPEFFKIDKINGRYYKYKNGTFKLSTPGECVGLERAAVWDPVHVEERLKAHFSGETSIFETSLRA